VTRQETTFTRTINRNQRLQTKHRKNNMSIWPAGLSAKAASKRMPGVSPTSVLFNLFVIMKPLIYFRVCHGTPINKILKTRITCKEIKYFFIRHFNKWTVITEVKKARNVMTRLLLQFWNVSATFKISQKESVSQMCVIPFFNFDSWSTFGLLRIRRLFYIWTTLLITVHTFAVVIISLHIR